MEKSNMTVLLRFSFSVSQKKSEELEWCNKLWQNLTHFFVWISINVMSEINIESKELRSKIQMKTNVKRYWDMNVLKVRL